MFDYRSAVDEGTDFLPTVMSGLAAATGLGGGAAGTGGFATDSSAQALASLGRGLMQEGAAGFLDPAGMLDRQQAQRDLAGKFQVVADDYAGPRTPNMVTQAEYNSIARTYSDIRLGRSDLQINASTSADPDQYRADMMDDIGDIMQTKSGRALVGQLSNNTNGVNANGTARHLTTTLQPFLKPDGSINNTNAEESGDISPGIGAPFANGTPGRGGNTTIRANPNVDLVSTGANNGVFRSDVALYHEMTHALHDTRGTTDTGSVQAGDSLTRELRAGNVGGVVGEMLHPSPHDVKDAGAGLARYEHQAAGLGLYANAAISGNRYRDERQRLALTGQGLPGDLRIGHRDHYVGFRGNHAPYLGL